MSVTPILRIEIPDSEFRAVVAAGVGLPHREWLATARTCQVHWVNGRIVADFCQADENLLPGQKP